MKGILIAGGGTGGHLFPGVAIAEAIRRFDPSVQIRFVGTARGLEARVVPELGYDLTLIDVSGLKTVGGWGALKGLFRLPRALWQAVRLLRRERPRAVLGVGGYASGPVLLAAWLLRIPTAICEQNSIPGLTNKWLGRIVQRVFLSFETAAAYFPAHKCMTVGNPIRHAIVTSLALPRSANAVPHVLVSGGSLGARAMNPIVADALILLASEMPLRITHQTGEQGLADTQARYQAAGVAAMCHAFVRDMATLYREVDVVVGRAGATTVAELALAGLPAVFIPYPFAADNHQETNAQAMVAAGGARMVRQADLTSVALADVLRPLVREVTVRAQMSAAMRTQARPDAADLVAQWVFAPQKP